MRVCPRWTTHWSRGFEANHIHALFAIMVAFVSSGELGSARRDAIYIPLPTPNSDEMWKVSSPAMESALRNPRMIPFPLLS